MNSMVKSQKSTWSYVGTESVKSSYDVGSSLVEGGADLLDESDLSD